MRSSDRVRRAQLLSLVALMAWPLIGRVRAQDAVVTLSGSIALTEPTSTLRDRSGVVVWLTPVGDVGRTRLQAANPPRFRMEQKGKRFGPRVLAVPTGSVVDFPNFDPILHNVFSLFDGKRFDLGLYEAGTSRSVTFAKPGVSHVFCNIHPEMSAIIVTVDSVHHATSDARGTFALDGVPPGRYRLSLWHDRLKPDGSEYPREITVSPDSSTIGSLRLVDTGKVLASHKNKFGQDYVSPTPLPIYRQ